MTDYIPSSCAGLDDVAVEGRVTQREVLGVLTEQFRKDGLSLVSRRVLVDVAVHEAVHLGRVRMDVDVEVQVYVLQSIYHNTTQTGLTGLQHLAYLGFWFGAPLASPRGQMGAVAPPQLSPDRVLRLSQIR